jgi:hypothetical protein
MAAEGYGPQVDSMCESSITSPVSLTSATVEVEDCHHDQ